MTMTKTIIFCIANAGTGKTFTGDYLEIVHGFTHVDGDGPARKSGRIPEYKDMTDKLMECLSTKYHNKVAPDEIWQPYMKELATLTVEATKNSDKVVLTFACLRQEWRDYIMQILKDGVSEEDTVSMLYLTINEDVKLEGLYYRSKRQCEGVGMTLEDVMRLQGWDSDGDRDLSVEEYKTFSKNTPGQCGSFLCVDPPSYAKVVDVTGRDVTALDGVDTALGLQRDPNLSYEEIVERVLAIDHKRDAESSEGYTEEEIKEFFAKMKHTGENKKSDTEMEHEHEKIINMRRSSLLSVESLNHWLTVSDDATTNRSKSRRESLIMTGKLVSLSLDDERE